MRCSVWTSLAPLPGLPLWSTTVGLRLISPQLFAPLGELGRALRQAVAGP
jgi:hypothetical protein